MLIWTAVLLFILYGFLKSCFGGESGTSGPRSPRRPGPGWFPGAYDNGPTDSPPPYSKHSDTSTSASPAQEQGWRPGFWTGAAAAGLGTYLFSNTNRQDRTRTTAYDWERTRQATGYRPSSFSSSYSGRQRTEDRGEGSSSLGSMRRSTGIGGSSVR
ncbi:hypothetical protein PHLCEN_2v5076 [Hermanssonia centrifuga]|uniref:Store-operated calcium entry-associated regulatory factor n=1 Tax=Hermanssonia centrifuga TaxID=98765 RepID=A0A2R6PBW5_9APHY|nr:hypothetical protein PHLCEN_2v5076 [Hermanssonia centrifuga]